MFIIQNIYNEGKLELKATIKESLIVQKEGELESTVKESLTTALDGKNYKQIFTTWVDFDKMTKQIEFHKKKEEQ